MMRRRSSRAYTLLEVVIVAVISSALLYLGMRWVYSISTASVAASASEQGSQLTYALDNLEDDLRAATTCDEYGLQDSLRSLSPEVLVIISNQPAGPGSDPVPTSVAWRMTEGGELQRSTFGCAGALPASAADLDSLTWRTMASGVVGAASLGTTSEPVLFQPVLGGRATSEGSAYDDCKDGCTASAVKVSLATTAGTASTARVLDFR